VTTPPKKKRDETMIHAEYEFHVAAPLAEVFAYISDVRNDKIWQSSIKDIELTSPQTSGNGTTYRISYGFLGRKMDFHARVTEADPAGIFKFQTESGPISYWGRYTMRDESGGTSVKWGFDAEVSGFFGIIPHALIRQSLIKTVSTDAKRMRSILEAKVVEAIATA
jgi:carbon monoxide dehydrogenase subunit G